MITWLIAMDRKAWTFWQSAKCLSVSFKFLSELKSWCIVWKQGFFTNSAIPRLIPHLCHTTEFCNWAIVFCCLTYTQVWTVSCCVRKRQLRSRNICWSRCRWGGGSPCWPPGFLSGWGCTVQLYHHLAVCVDGTLSNFNNGHLAIETV